MNTLTIEFKDIPELKRELKTLCNQFGIEQLTLEDFKASGPIMISELRLAQWIQSALAQSNITRLNQLEKLNASEFVALHGLGHAALREVNELLSEYHFQTIDN